MRSRGQDSEETIALRLSAAREEMSHYAEFDFLIVNDDFESAVREMQSIFLASRLRIDVQAERHSELIRALLQPD
jgi:guanylate kinase